MIFAIDRIDTTPGQVPGVVPIGETTAPCPAFIPPASITTRKAYAEWLRECCVRDEGTAQAVYMARWWVETQWSRPLRVTGPFADAFPRLLTWLKTEVPPLRQAYLEEMRRARVAADEEKRAFLPSNQDSSDAHNDHHDLAYIDQDV